MEIYRFRSIKNLFCVFWACLKRFLVCLSVGLLVV